jgi:hypothetical protein
MLRQGKATDLAKSSECQGWTQSCTVSSIDMRGGHIQGSRRCEGDADRSQKGECGYYFPNHYMSPKSELRPSFIGLSKSQYRSTFRYLLLIHLFISRMVLLLSRLICLHVKSSSVLFSGISTPTPKMWNCLYVSYTLITKPRGI